jgi:RNA polymerase sigma factor (sigma-70 family)
MAVEDTHRSPEEWKKVVEQIQAGNPEGEETLYRTLSGGARFFLQRRLGTEQVDDAVHDLFITVVEAIRNRQLKEPERLMGFVRTILYRQAADRSRAGPGRREMPFPGSFDVAAPAATASPEQSTLRREKVELMMEVLREMRKRDMEVLIRFYLREQTEDQIRAEMSLTPTQFRLLKSRAKARFEKLVQKRYSRKHL